MIQTIIGKKLEQSQKFLENGKRVPVTHISVANNVVTQLKTTEKEGYSAVQLGFGTKKKPTKAVFGHAKKAGLEKAPVILKEVRITDEADLPQAGEFVAVASVLKPGDIVDVTGTSKGKGFAGVVKRHNFRGGPKTHGQSDRHRAPGSIGQTTTPGRVYKGKRMAGRMGSDTVTVANLTVVAVDEAAQTVLVAGLVPGAKKSILYITKTGEEKKFVELLEEKIKREAAEAETAKIEAENAAKEAEKQSEEIVSEPAVEEVKEELKAEAPASEKLESVDTDQVKTEEEAVKVRAQESVTEEKK